MALPNGRRGTSSLDFAGEHTGHVFLQLEQPCWRLVCHFGFVSIAHEPARDPVQMSRRSYRSKDLTGVRAPPAWPGECQLGLRLATATSALQHSTVQYSKVRYSTAQIPCTAPFCWERLHANDTESARHVLAARTSVPSRTTATSMKDLFAEHSESSCFLVLAIMFATELMSHVE